MPSAARAFRYKDGRQYLHYNARDTASVIDFGPSRVGFIFQSRPCEADRGKAAGGSLTMQSPESEGTTITATLPPRGEYFTALLSRLSRACCSRRLSARSVSPGSTRTRIGCLAGLAPKWSTTSLPNAARPRLSKC